MRQIASVNFKKTFIFSCLFKEDFLRVHQTYASYWKAQFAIMKVSMTMIMKGSIVEPNFSIETDPSIIARDVCIC